MLIALTSQAQEFQEGVQYKKIDSQIEAASNSNEVYEFFGYTCGACNAFEPHLESFENSNPDVTVIRVPVVFHETWKPFARAYYTAETMGFIDKVHKSIFRAIHQQKKKLRSIEDIAVFLETEFKIDKEKFLATSKSFSVDSKIRKAQQLARKLGVMNTPTMVVNNTFISSPAMLPKSQSSYGVFIQLIEHLLTVN